MLLFAAAAAHAETLYEALGGERGLQEFVSQYVDVLTTDPITGPSFTDSSPPRIKRLLTEQLCELSGGPCRYSGDSMREVHANLGITEAQFHVAVQRLRELMVRRGYPLAVRNEMLRLLAPMQRDVVDVVIAKPAAAESVSP
jgi:hemoglobin